MTEFRYDGRLLHYVDSDAKWQVAVCELVDNQCQYPGCTCRRGVKGHHGVPRGFLKTRLVVENGVALCPRHHNLVEHTEKQGNYSPYDKTMEILMGKQLYRDLQMLATMRERPLE